MHFIFYFYCCWYYFFKKANILYTLVFCWMSAIGSVGGQLKYTATHRNIYTINVNAWCEVWYSIWQGKTMIFSFSVRFWKGDMFMLNTEISQRCDSSKLSILCWYNHYSGSQPFPVRGTNSVLTQSSRNTKQNFW